MAGRKHGRRGQAALGSPRSDASGEEVAKRRDGVVVDSSGLRCGLDGVPPDMDHDHLWVLKAALDEPSRDQSLVDEAKASESASPLGTRPVAAFRDVLRINAYVRDHPVWKRVETGWLRGAKSPRAFRAGLESGVVVASSSGASTPRVRPIPDLVLQRGRPDI